MVGSALAGMPHVQHADAKRRACFTVHTRRKWVWAGVGFELGFAVLLVALQGLALTFIGRELWVAHACAHERRVQPHC